MGHGIGDEAAAVPGPLDAATAERVATTLQALATPSRLRILSQLRGQAMAVGDLAAAVAMEQSAVSHQLRLLRNLGLVTGVREGRSIVYSLYDSHVAQLLDEAVYHSEHLRMGLADRPATAAATT
ncbi:MULTISPECIES: ArsR/SmtB family transcription factor [Tsukamurella]|uniref:DNA-binding transcriptional regulator, ArsR family n=2 Tax=Tsukamurella TaxID=2060 RepID=A0A1H1ARP9_9ACTN|nr:MULTISPECIES: metalloregulator ArsR/SmtB family transcription factor [Tsukamurella]KXO92880.1 ArsR family transcriptional regulator [Tsukamurella pulmonis]KXP14157.1 ArsR family transcriptional regulator [Tsukamurella pseudospumae]SDQ42415.1 DNA-binding transcriptional regulator, ArsR family [Tsukamurella pulmonis]SUP26196.1 HTH-type transcriptional repressor CzrA [Tsukamurella pulmonis]